MSILLMPDDAKCFRCGKQYTNNEKGWTEWNYTCGHMRKFECAQCQYKNYGIHTLDEYPHCDVCGRGEVYT